MTDDVGHIDKMNLLKLTYTQVYSLEDSENLKRRFNQFLKYNEAVFLNLPVNLMVVDAHERVKIVNESCKAYFHREGEAFVNQPLAQLLGGQNEGDAHPHPQGAALRPRRGLLPRAAGHRGQRNGEQHPDPPDL